VESLLALTLGDEVNRPQNLCKCTSFSHDDVRRLILKRT
jgi:nitrite reductase (NADH) large subunit